PLWGFTMYAHFQPLYSMRMIPQSSAQPRGDIANIRLDIVEPAGIANHRIASWIGHKGRTAGTRIPVVIAEMMEARFGDTASAARASLKRDREIELAMRRLT